MPKNRIFQALAQNGWIQNTSVTVLPILTAIICIAMKMSTLRTIVITACVLLTVLVWTAGVTIIRMYDNPDEGLKIKVLYSSYAGDSAVWWLRYTSSLGDTISPMPVLLSMSITNTRDIPVTLDSLAISVQLNDGPWVDLQHINSRWGSVWYITDLKDAGLLDLSENGLDTILLKPIEPHKPVRGIMFFDTPSPVLPFADDWIRYKWAAKDTAGTEYVVLSERTRVRTTPPDVRDAQFNDTALHFSKAHLDLRRAGLKTQRWYNTGVVAVPNK